MTAPEYVSHLGVYSFITAPCGEKLLLIKKALGCYTGLYDLPGGSMEPHETTEETLIRETLEETCCAITSYNQMGAFTALHRYLKDGRDYILRHIGIIYAAEISGTPTTKPAGGDSAGCVWIDMRDLSEKNSAPLVLQALAAWQNRHK